MKHTKFFGKGMKFFTAFFLGFFCLVTFFFFFDPVEDRFGNGMMMLAIALVYLGGYIGTYFYHRNQGQNDN